MKKYILSAAGIVLLSLVAYLYHTKQTQVEYKYDYFQSMDSDCQYHFHMIRGLQLNFPQFDKWKETNQVKIIYNNKDLTTINIDADKKRSYYPNIFGEKEHYEQIIEENNIFNSRFKLFFYPYSYYDLMDTPLVHLNIQFLDKNGNILFKTDTDYDLENFNSQIIFPQDFSIVKKDNVLTASSQTNIPYHMVLQWKYNLDDYFEQESKNVDVKNTLEHQFDATPSYLGVILYTKKDDVSFEYKIQLWNNKTTQVCLNNDFKQQLIEHKD